ncbi:MAG TPA: excinuclease ABC subunit UvrB [Candidatus Pacearchaeota archaeon]|nr:excinuclease ABC subunit UvrB [Candidatus Pacearchaeota archaeon]HOL90149.1 excinuclease ABC subunit UvrB [Candidatus Pacearchaeota archaeon]HPO68250.1 excinuclease ABC subunit UvrB [Candidatus Pacearchaeota archaeon]
MELFKLHSPYKPSGGQPEAIEKLVYGLKKGYRFQTLLGVTGSGKTFTMANVISHFDRPVLVIAPNKTLAAQLYREYKTFFPENSVNYFVSYYDYYQPEAYLPISDTYIEKEALINEEIDKLRHRATSALLLRRDVIIIASVSCIYNLGLPLNYFGSSLHLEVGKSITRGDLIRQLIKIQFERTNSVLKRGTFRVRGDVFEIMPASGDIINYIEISDQKIKKILLEDPFKKTILKETEELVIFPVKHFISSEPQREKAIEEIKKELKERIEYFKKNKLFLEAERLERRTRYDIEMLKSIGYCHGIENYSRHLNGKLSGEAPETLLSYFPQKNGKPDFITIIDESHISIPQIRGMYEGDRARKETLIQYGWRLPSALDNRPLKFKEFLERIDQAIFTSATPSDFEKKNSEQIVELIIRPTGLVDPLIEVRPVFDKEKNRGQIDDIIEEIELISQKNERAIINVLTKKMAEDLTDFLLKKNIKVNYLHSDIKTLKRTEILTDFRRGKFNVLVGVNLLREGLDFPEVTLVAILDADREGFLRSETSLIQIMGRCARNVSGKVILYADNITGSIKRAIKESERRRNIQMEYNKKHNIVPASIKKKIENLID